MYVIGGSYYELLLEIQNYILRRDVEFVYELSVYVTKSCVRVLFYRLFRTLLMLHAEFNFGVIV